MGNHNEDTFGWRSNVGIVDIHQHFPLNQYANDNTSTEEHKRVDIDILDLIIEGHKHGIELQVILIP